jgi:hypothetical protein
MEERKERQRPVGNIVSKKNGDKIERRREMRCQSLRPLREKQKTLGTEKRKSERGWDWEEPRGGKVTVAFPRKG